MHTKPPSVTIIVLPGDVTAAPIFIPCLVPAILCVIPPAGWGISDSTVECMLASSTDNALQKLFREHSWKDGIAVCPSGQGTVAALPLSGRVDAAEVTQSSTSALLMGWDNLLATAEEMRYVAKY